MKTITILLVLTLALAVWTGTATAGTSDKWVLGQRATISRVEEGRGGGTVAAYTRIPTSPEKFAVSARPVMTTTGAAVCRLEVGRGGAAPAKLIDHGSKWQF